MTKIDALDIFCLNKPGYTLNGRYDLKEGSLHYHVKSPKGFPIDARRFDNDWIYDQQTEGNPPDGWANPADIKVHVANGGKGIRICPRFISSFPTTVEELDSPYYIIQDGKWDYNIKSVARTKCVLHAPVNKDWQGDVDTVPSYQFDYSWGGHLQKDGSVLYSDLEVYWYAQSFGLVEWLHYTWKNGKYVLVGSSGISNKLQKLSPYPSPVMPFKR